jgi:hypothetical protein
MLVNNEPTIIPTTPLRAAQRALVLSAVVCRSRIESDAGNKDAERFREDVLNWLFDLGLSDEIEKEEYELLISPLELWRSEKSLMQVGVEKVWRFWLGH